MGGKDIDTAEAVVGWIREVLPLLPGDEYKALEIELPDLVLLEAYITHLEAVAEAAREMQQGCVDLAVRYAACPLNNSKARCFAYGVCQALSTLDMTEHKGEAKQ